MSDDVDQAQDATADYVTDCIDAVLSRRLTGEGAELCDECGAEIPAARRQAVPGCWLCVSCQEAEEGR